MGQSSPSADGDSTRHGVAELEAPSSNVPPRGCRILTLSLALLRAQAVTMPSKQPVKMFLRLLVYMSTMHLSNWCLLSLAEALRILKATKTGWVTEMPDIGLIHVSARRSIWETTTYWQVSAPKKDPFQSSLFP